MLKEKKCQVSTIKGYKSVISNTLKFKSGTNIGSDPIISELIKAFKIQRPIQRWDLACVYVKTLMNLLNKALLLHFTMKTAFLLMMVTVEQISEIHALAMDAEHLSFDKTDGSVSLRAQMGFLAKNQLPSKSSSTIFIPNLAKTLNRENDKGDHDITKGSIAWRIAFRIKTAYRKLTTREMSFLKIKAHELRALSTSWAYQLKKSSRLQFGPIRPPLPDSTWETCIGSSIIYAF